MHCLFRVCIHLDRFVLLGCLGTGVLGVVPVSHAQTSTPAETGRPIITHYTPSDYGAHPQNSAIVQDNRGVMYFGNTGGVLEYDGVSWRLITLPNKSRVMSLDMDADGRIWVGGQGEIGYLAPDSLGQPGYLSLVDHINYGAMAA